MKLKEIRRLSADRWISWQYAKHAKLCSDLHQAWKREQPVALITQI